MTDTKRTPQLPGARVVLALSRRGVLEKRPSVLNAMETGAGIGASFLSTALAYEGNPLQAAGMAALGSLPPLERTINAVRIGLKAVDKADIHPTAKQEIKKILVSQAALEGMTAAAKIIPAAIMGDAVRSGDRSTATSVGLHRLGVDLGLQATKAMNLGRGATISRDDAKKIEAFIKSSAAKREPTSNPVARGLGLGAVAAATAAGIGLAHPAGRRRARKIVDAVRRVAGRPPGGGPGWGPRYQAPPRPPSGGTSAPLHSDFQGLGSRAEFKSRWRAAARQHHPDLGGDPEKMKAVNARFEAFRRSPQYEKLAMALWPSLARTLVNQGR